jgi:hypothetical protein
METMVDANEILSTRNLIEVGVQADEVRRRLHGARTTFVRVLEIAVEEGSAGATLDDETTVGELRLVGAPSETGVVVATSMAAEVAKLHRSLGKFSGPVTGFALHQLRGLARDAASFAALCRRLREAGLEAIAEVALDDRDGLEEAIVAAREAGLGLWRLTVHSLPKESPEGLDGLDPRIAFVERARDLQNAVGGFKAFAPLPRQLSIAAPTTGYDDVKLVALARLVVTNIESIQVDWPLYGPKLAQVALTMGADDVDGVTAVDKNLLGARRSPLEEIKGNIRAAGLEAAERDGSFRLIG